MKAILKISLPLVVVLCLAANVFAQNGRADSSAMEKLRRESGVDPTRVQTRAGYTLFLADYPGDVSQVGNRISLNVGVNRWAFTTKYEVISRSQWPGESGFSTGSGDLRFSVLNAFWVDGKNALAASAEFFVPTGKAGFGTQYFSVSPGLTYSRTISPSLFFAIQPQYTLDLVKDPRFPSLDILTVRTFLAKFTKTGYFFVAEGRPVYNFQMERFDFVVSPIIGKALGGGFNLIGLAEFAIEPGVIPSIMQFGFNKNF